MSQQVHFDLAPSTSARAQGQARRRQSATAQQLRHDSQHDARRKRVRLRENAESYPKHPPNLSRRFVSAENQLPAENETHNDLRTLLDLHEQDKTRRPDQPPTSSKTYKCSICSPDPGDASASMMLRRILSGHHIEYHFDEVSRCQVCDSSFFNHQHDQHWIFASDCCSTAPGDSILLDQNGPRMMPMSKNLDANSVYLSPESLMQDVPLWASQFSQGVCISAKFRLAADQVAYHQSRRPDTTSTPELGFEDITYGTTPQMDIFTIHQHWYMPFLAFLQCLRRDWPKLLGVAELGFVNVRWVALQAELRSVWYITPLAGPEHHLELVRDSSYPAVGSDTPAETTSMNFQ